jgi:hypothetical protein
LCDASGSVADLFGAKRTPEVFLLDGERRIVYQGRIDDQYGLGFKRIKPTRRDLAEAIDELLAGRAISVARTNSSGCMISRAGQAKTEGSVTFVKQVSSIIQKKCQDCHRTGQVAPMALTNYDEVLAWSDTIREVVADRRMPPWHADPRYDADPRYGEFSNDRSLSTEERAILRTWLDSGCPKGDDKIVPAAAQIKSTKASANVKLENKGADDWMIGKPDAILKMPVPFTVPAKADEKGIAYQYFSAVTEFPSDVWVQAAEARPGNRAVVHHIIMYIRPPAGRESNDKADQIGNGFLTGYAPGDMPEIFPPGMAKRIPKGSELIFQVHYTPNGVETEDCSSVGLVFAKSRPRREVRTRGIQNESFTIPKGAKNYQVVASTSFSREVELLSFTPHMHLRGKDFEYQITYPNGRSEVLLSVPNYDFSWQSTYRLKKPFKVPPGARIDCVAHFDNSADNPNNPDSTKEVRWGDQTWEEMMIGFVDYSYTPLRTTR